ncbi:neural cell adhesion molecule 1 [Biomphalaria glabrata]
MVKEHVLISKCKYHLILLHVLIAFEASLAQELEKVVVKETDTVTLVCPRQSQSVAKLFVTYTNGQKEWYADFKADNTCATLGSYMKCSKNNLSNLLTIPVSKTSRGIASYSCGDNLIYSVSFYVEPSDFKCGKPLLDSSGAFINITCNTSKIYPDLKCGFKDVLNKSTTIIFNEEISYKLLESYGVPEYYKAQCTLSVNVTKLPFGEHQLQVTVQLKNITKVEVKYSIEPSITLYPLKTRLDQSCPEGPNVVKGYIQAGTNATCKCFKSTGYGTVFWTKGSIKLDQGDTYATLTVTYPTDHNKTFDCRASQYELDSIGTSFTAEFAYGPDELFLSKSNIRMELCTETTVTCFTTSNHVNPSAQFEWSVIDPKAISIIPVIATSNFSSTVRLLALRPGKHIVTCKGYNAIFPDKDSEIDIVVVIKGTSFVQPKITISKVQRLEVNLEIVNITCSTDVEIDLSLTCLNKTLRNRTSTLTMVQNMKEADNGALCSCSSDYLCNIKQTEKATIFLAYGPMQFIKTTRAIEISMCERALIPAVVPKHEVSLNALFNISVNEPDSLQWKVLFGNGTATIEVFTLKTGQFQLKVDVYDSYDLSSKTASAIDVLVLGVSRVF